MEHLPKSKHANLETDRVIVSAETLLGMEETHKFFEVLKREFPEIQGITFFGSRIRGKERTKKKVEIFSDPVFGSYTQTTFKSDLDMILFYDENLMDDIENQDEHALELRDNQINIKLLRFTHNYLKRVKKLPMLDISPIDISKNETAHILQIFKQKVLESVKNPPLRINFDLNQENPFFIIASRFLPSFGGTSHLCEPIIADFEKDKNGKTYWKILMRVLAEFERPTYDHHKDEPTPTGLPKYKYPETLEEGRTFFLSQKHLPPKKTI